MKRFFAMLLALCMALSLVQGSVLAEDEQTMEQPFETAETPEDFYSTAQLEKFLHIGTTAVFYFGHREQSLLLAQGSVPVWIRGCRGSIGKDFF